MHLLSERGDATDMAVQLCAANAIKEGVDVSDTVDLADSAAVGVGDIVLLALPTANHGAAVSSGPNAKADAEARCS